MLTSRGLGNPPVLLDGSDRTDSSPSFWPSFPSNIISPGLERLLVAGVSSMFTFKSNNFTNTHWKTREDVKRDKYLFYALAPAAGNLVLFVCVYLPNAPL